VREDGGGRRVFERAARHVISAALLAVVPPSLALAQPVRFQLVASGLDDVTDIANAGDDRLFVVEQAGVIRIVEPGGTVRPTPFLDIRSRIRSGGEQGLLGLAFHPDFAVNRFFYVNYTDLSGDTVVARYRVGVRDPNVVSPATERVLLRQDQPFANHNGGDLAFGPADGFLYVALGDGGNGCDPSDFAQDPRSLLGKILRIDVDAAFPYAIPPDNPFAGRTDALPEIWSLGLRNPWRLGFDRRPPHDLFIADVGQGLREEVSVQPGGSSGGENYGWDCFEGRAPGTCSTQATCPPVGGHVLPIHDYTHEFGCSVTGGFVYRGARFPRFGGEYFFSDFCSQILWSLARRGAGWQLTTYGAPVPEGPRSFGEDADGELYVGGDTSVFRIEDPNQTTPIECPATPSPCDEPGRAVLLLADSAPAGPSTADRLVFRFLRGPAEAPSAFGNPADDTDLRLCIYAESEALLLQAIAPGGGTCGGAPCWSALGSSGFLYTDAAGAKDGLTRVLLRPLPADPGSKIVFAGAGSELSLPVLPLPAGENLSVRVHSSANDACWGADFSPADVVRNDAAAYKALHLD
jgi:glucose/arabinose dehydrogenase